MKKFTMLFLIFLCLSFNIMGATSVVANGSNILKQGVYTLSDLNISPDNMYTVQNTSSTNKSYILVFDDNDVKMQSIRLFPNSTKFNLISIKPDYKIVVLGKGEVYINPISPK